MSSSKARVERRLGLVVVNAVAGKDPHIFGDDAETFIRAATWRPGSPNEWSTGVR
jgi:hypothetical protein